MLTWLQCFAKWQTAAESLGCLWMDSADEHDRFMVFISNMLQLSSPSSMGVKGLTTSLQLGSLSLCGDPTYEDVVLTEGRAWSYKYRSSDQLLD